MERWRPGGRIRTETRRRNRIVPEEMERKKEMMEMERKGEDGDGGRKEWMEEGRKNLDGFVW